MTNNYISINGKKIPLTDEQVEQIKNAGIVKDNPFKRGKNGDKYYYIGSDSILCTGYDYPSISDDNRFKIANYCTNEKLMEQRALHETLNRLLWRFSMTHGGDEINWGANIFNYRIYYNHDNNKFEVECNSCWQGNDCYFKDIETAEQAIKEIVKPFMEQHPEFVW